MLSLRSGEALRLPLSILGESIDGEDEGNRGRVDDVVLSKRTMLRDEGALVDERPRCEGGAMRS